MNKLTRAITAFALAIVLAICATGCNQQIVDLNYKFDYVQISMPDGNVISGRVTSWKDFEDGDQIQVTVDGNTFLTHINRVVLCTHNPY